ncbi:MAG: beta-galactosidase [Candidatus Saccharimonadales bacterium]
MSKTQRNLPVSKRTNHKFNMKVRPSTKHHTTRLRHWHTKRDVVQKIAIWLMLIVFFVISTMYGIARWYIWQNQNKPMVVGVTFIPSYARYYDLDPKQTMRALIDELNVKQFRLVSYWDESEPNPGQYDFSELDWQFKYAEDAGAKVSLAIGLRQPRWPECHMPKWAMSQTKEQWQNELKKYMKTVIERYKNSPALESYQLENEYFMTVFGECPDHSRDRLIDEYHFVKQIDPEHPVIISRSNNAVGLPLGQPRPDEFGISIYKRVWDKNITKRYFEYPFPAWFYGFLAGAGKIATGKDMIIHELQAEPWAPTETKTASLAEQNKSLDPKRLRQRFTYGEATGMREMYLWGVEWWYWRKVKFNDPGVWDVAKQEINRIQSQSSQ